MTFCKDVIKQYHKKINLIWPFNIDGYIVRTWVTCLTSEHANWWYQLLKTSYTKWKYLCHWNYFELSSHSCFMESLHSAFFLLQRRRKTYQAYCMYFKWISVLSVHSLKIIHVITIILSFSITLHSFLQKRATKHVVATVHTWYRSVCCQCLPYYHVVICMYFWLVTHLIRK